MVKFDSERPFNVLSVRNFVWMELVLNRHFEHLYTINKHFSENNCERLETCKVVNVGVFGRLRGVFDHNGKTVTVTFHE